MIWSLAVVLIAGFVFAGSMVRSADRRMRANYLEQARQIGRTFNLEDIKALAGTKADLGAPAYVRIKNQLETLRAALPKCRSLYLFGRRANGQVYYYYADSEPPGSKDEASPGEVIAIGPESLKLFENKRALMTGPIPDFRGNRMSAYVMLNDPLSGLPVAAFGLDIDVGGWWRDIIRDGLVILAFTLLLAGVILGGGIALARAARRGATPISGHGETLLVAVAGVVISLAATWAVREYSAHAYHDAFCQLANSEIDSLGDSFHALHDIELEGVARFFEGSESVTPREFSTYTDNLAKDAVVHAWEWIAAVPAGEKDRFENQVRQEGNSAFMIWEKDPAGKSIAASGRQVYYPILLMNPLSGREKWLGFDLGSEPLQREAFEKAQQSGLVTITEPVVDAPGNQAERSLIAYRPVFFRDQPGHLRGYAGVRVNCRVLLERTVDGSQNPEGPSMSGDFFQLRAGMPPLRLASTSWDRHASDSVSVVRFLAAFGGIYSVEMRPEPAFDAFHRSYVVWLAALTGLLLTGTLVVLFDGVVHRRRNLERLVEERTAALSESEESFRRLFVNNPVPMALSSLEDMIFRDVNGAYLSVFGYSLKEIIGKTSEEIGLYVRPDQSRAVMEQVMRDQRIANFEIQFRCKDGRVGAGLLSGEKIVVHGREYFLGVMVDISERQRAETERMRLATAIEQTGETIIVSDPRGAILYANPAFEATSGYSCEEVEGKTFGLFKSGKHDEAFYRELWSTIKTGKTWRGKFVNKKKDGTLYDEDAVISPVRNAFGEIVNYVAVKRDISNEVKLERQLLQSQKMESVGRLAGGVAHDFNNMLGIILGYTDLALGKVKTSQPIHEELHEIQMSAQRAADLTRQLLAFARKQTVAPKVVNINEAVGGMLKILQRLIGENIEVVWKPGPELWPVKIDPSQVDQILTNLCVNARDAIAGAGRIVIATANITLDRDWCHGHEGAIPGDYALLTVADDGCGMTPQVLAHVFEPFFTTKGVGQGTGLGMATVYGIVKQNDGFILVSSREGGGTTVSIYLPRQENVEILVTEVDSAGPIARGHETILVVEDEPVLLRMNKMILRRLGYKVVTANRPGEALQFADSQADNIHLLLTDVIMPDMNGVELSREILKRYPGIKCMFMSGYPADAIVKEDVLKDGLHFIQKPFTSFDLAAAVRKALDQG